MNNAEQQRRRLDGRLEPPVYEPPLLSAVEVPWRAATPAEVASSRSVKGLAAAAAASGADLRARFARGPFIGSDGTQLDVADALALVLFDATGHMEAWGIWYRRDNLIDPKTGKTKWVFSSAWSSEGRLSSREFKEFLEK